MADSRFVYTTYIRTTPDKLWTALIDPEFTRQYWYQAVQICDWKKGSKWQLKMPDGMITDMGEVVEVDPPRRLVLTWQNQFRPELKVEGFSKMTYEIEQMEGAVKLTVIHEIDRSESKLIGAVSNGWPTIFASLKSLLETGESLEFTRHWPKKHKV